MAVYTQRARRQPVANDELVYAGDEVVAPSPLTIVARIVWFVTGVIEIILGLRFLLSLLGANPNNAFANFIYDISHPFVAPFFGLFNYNVVNYGVSRFEIYTLVAMLVYVAIAWGITYLLTIGRRY